jgi:hypothetical protein
VITAASIAALAPRQSFASAESASTLLVRDFCFENSTAFVRFRVDAMH